MIKEYNIKIDNAFASAMIMKMQVTGERTLTKNEMKNTAGFLFGKMKEKGYDVFMSFTRNETERFIDENKNIFTFDDNTFSLKDNVSVTDLIKTFDLSQPSVVMMILDEQIESLRDDKLKTIEDIFNKNISSTKNNINIKNINSLSDEDIMLYIMAKNQVCLKETKDWQALVNYAEKIFEKKKSSFVGKDEILSSINEVINAERRENTNSQIDTLIDLDKKILSIQSKMMKAYDKKKPEIPDERKIAQAVYLIHLGVLSHLKKRGLVDRVLSNKNLNEGNFEECEYIFC